MAAIDGRLYRIGRRGAWLLYLGILGILLAGCRPAPAASEPKATRPAVDTPFLVPGAVPSPAATATGEPIPAASMSAEARAYLDHALSLMQEHALHRSQVNWERVSARVYASAGSALTPRDTYPAIEFALRSLADNHSRLLPPEQVADLESGEWMSDLPAPSGKLLDDRLAYLTMPSFAGSPAAGVEYAAAIQGLIRELDAALPCGWIVDLQDNQGGDFWPMLAGVGPLLGEGPAGAFVDSDAQQVSWAYAAGRAIEGTQVQVDLGLGRAYYPTEPLPQVAVLVDRQTASSGEAILVAFRGRANSRSFGRETAGLSTGNEAFPLADGARLYLTVSRFADRTGQLYGGIITPDEYVREPGSAPILESAVGWLLDQPACLASHTP